MIVLRGELVEAIISDLLDGLRNNTFLFSMVICFVGWLGFRYLKERIDKVKSDAEKMGETLSSSLTSAKGEVSRLTTELYRFGEKLSYLEGFADGKSSDMRACQESNHLPNRSTKDFSRDISEKYQSIEIEEINKQADFRNA